MIDTKHQPINPALENFDRLPDSAHVRVGVVAALQSCSIATVWRRAKAGTLPAPRKIGGTTVWSVGALRKTLA